MSPARSTSSTSGSWPATTGVSASRSARDAAKVRVFPLSYAARRDWYVFTSSSNARHFDQNSARAPVSPLPGLPNCPTIALGALRTISATVVASSRSISADLPLIIPFPGATTTEVTPSCRAGAMKVFTGLSPFHASNPAAMPCSPRAEASL